MATDHHARLVSKTCLFHLSLAHWMLSSRYSKFDPLSDFTVIFSFFALSVSRAPTLAQFYASARTEDRLNSVIRQRVVSSLSCRERIGWFCFQVEHVASSLDRRCRYLTVVSKPCFSNHFCPATPLRIENLRQVHPVPGFQHLARHLLWYFLVAHLDDSKHLLVSPPDLVPLVFRSGCSVISRKCFRPVVGQQLPIFPIPLLLLPSHDLLPLISSSGSWWHLLQLLACMASTQPFLSGMSWIAFSILPSLLDSWNCWPLSGL